MEKRLLDYWYKHGIVKKYLDRNKNSRQKFSFLDGPITANNPMGVHHAWGRTYKDLWQRFYNMKGYAGRFQNGFDEQGLWVEVEVEKELGFKNKKDIEKLGIDKFVNLCKERVKKYSQIQTEQSKRLGYFMDWDNSYHTSSDQNNYAIWNFLKDVNEKGWLYKGRDSVPWCPRCGTAISQHEIATEEYKEITHESVFVRAPVVGKNKEFLLAWTTTPWTLPGNVFLAINPKEEYCQVELDGNNYWLMKAAAKRVFGPDAKIVKSQKGSTLIGTQYSWPFDDLSPVKKIASHKSFHTVVEDEEMVNEEEGTGIVHIAPGAGTEDFKLMKDRKEDDLIIPLIEEDASYLPSLDELAGQNAKKNPEIIFNYLKARDSGLYLFKTEPYKHRYPTCWRCKSELVWRVVDEWYISMDKPSNSKIKGQKLKLDKTYREGMVEVATQLNWMPSWGKDRELDWLQNMHDWLISKKRYWGLALPIWECKECGSFAVIGNKEELKEKAVEGWDKFEGNSPHRPWIDQVKIKCSECDKVVSRIPDVGSPWLDAGIVPFSTMPKDWFPADFITESFPGQFKNWFYSLIAMSSALTEPPKEPFENILGFATLLDERGEPMHKSKGNSIEFNEAADKIGVDVMRWMYSLQNPQANLLFGYHKADEIRRRFYLILWNSYKFFTDYANLASWNCDKTPTDIQNQLTILDKWILARLTELTFLVNESLSKYDSMSASRAIEDFVVNDLSTWYIRRSRDRVGPVADSKDQNLFLSTMYGVLVTLSKLLAPFLPFAAEDIYQNLTGKESVHLSDYPKGDSKLLDKNLTTQMYKARIIVEAGHAKRKELGIKLRQPLSSATIVTNAPKFLKDIEKLIKDELNVKQIFWKKEKGKIVATKEVVDKLTTVGVSFDQTITPKLAAEGRARDIIREIQQMRKEQNCKLDEKITVTLPNWPKEFEDYIKRETLAKELVKGPKIVLSRDA